MSTELIPSADPWREHVESSDGEAITTSNAAKRAYRSPSGTLICQLRSVGILRGAVLGADPLELGELLEVRLSPGASGANTSSVHNGMSRATPVTTVGRKKSPAPAASASVMAARTPPHRDPTWQG
jgi:hypothetical protein